MLWGWSYPYRLSFFIIEESKMKKNKSCRKCIENEKDKSDPEDLHGPSSLRSSWATFALDSWAELNHS
jgi:hypothetical protein